MNTEKDLNTDWKLVLGIKKNTLKREICCNCPWRPNFNCGGIHITSKRVCNIIKSNLQSPTPSVNK